MSGVNEELAAYFGTSASVSDDELQKQAQGELFLKMAEEEGIDIDQLDDAQVQELYDATFADDQGQGDYGLEAQAAEEFAEKQAAAEKFADAEFMGRTMAHAYVSELQKIAGSAGDAAKSVGGAVKRTAGRYKDIISGRRVRAAQAGIGKQNKRIASGIEDMGNPLFENQDALNRAGKSKASLKSFRNREAARTVGAAAGTAGVAGAAGIGGVKAFGGKKGEKTAEALDIQAAQLAFQKIAASEEFDMEEAESRLNAVLVLGPTETEKCAGVTDQETYLDIRSLELAELAGYPVTWG